MGQLGKIKVANVFGTKKTFSLEKGERKLQAKKLSISFVLE